MKKPIFILIFMWCLSANAQEDLFRRSETPSPDVNENRTVTFRVFAPEASKIFLSGNWMPRDGVNSPLEPLTKDSEGYWTLKTLPLRSEFYSYHLIVDGLRTIDPSNAHVIRDVGSISNVFIVPGGQGDYYKVNQVPHGTISKIWYDSPGNQKQRRVTVYTPPGYETSGNHYPVLYLLHGIGGDEDAWLGTGRTAEIMDNLIAQNLANPMIVVMPNGNVFQEASPGNGSSGFTTPTFNLPNTMDGKFEETFGELMKFISGSFRTIESKEYRALAGLSMGGYHTAYISANYPNTFDYLGLFSPALNNKPSNFPESPAYQNLEMKLNQQKENGYKLYWIAVGSADFPILLQGIEDFKKQLDSYEMPYEFKETDGGHSWENWRNYLVEFVPKLFW